MNTTIPPKPKAKREPSAAATRTLLRQCVACGFKASDLRFGYRAAVELGGVDISWHDFLLQAASGEITWLDRGHPSRN
jgi:hypothetical protein